ncbi:MAG: HAMP domain-containing histidine kinase [Streptomyces sp.]|nr:HAMP domain-containing histidine kinase [Streptomyces sp.]
MTPRPAGRPLQKRLALAYAAGIYGAGVLVLVLVDVPLADVGSTRHVDGPPPAANGAGVGLHRLLAGSAVALAVLVPVALALGWFVAGRFLHPLRAMTATAREISAGDLHRRLDLGEPADELTELGRTLDDLFARLQASFDAQRHFVANASHELRTPLAGLRTLLEVALADPGADADSLRATCEEALALGAHQERLVTALLALATSERGPSHRELLDLAGVAGGVLAARRAPAAERGIRLAEQLAPAPTAGDPRLVESLVANLVDNALRHNHPGGELEIATGTAGPYAVLTVANSGPNVPGDLVPHLFEPFRKLAPDARREGYGLGLAIVAAVARSHHAAVAAEPRPGGGLSVTVRFAHTSPR